MGLASASLSSIQGLAELPPDLVRLSRFFDDRFRLVGTDFRFGVDVLVGMVPVVGDLLMLFVSLYIVARAMVAGVSRRTTVRMLGNVCVDALLGVIPVFGFILDAKFRAHARNIELARRDLGCCPVRRRRPTDRPRADLWMPPPEPLRA